MIKYRNIFFVICVSIMCAIEIYPMLRLAKPSPHFFCDTKVRAFSEENIGWMLVCGIGVVLHHCSDKNYKPVSKYLKERLRPSIKIDKKDEKCTHNKSLSELKNGAQDVHAQKKVDEEKSKEIKEYCDKIKTITIMKYSGGINHENVQQYAQKQWVKVDDSRRSGDSSARDLNMLMVSAYVAKQMYDTAHSSSSYASNMENYSSLSYTDSSPSSGDSESSYSNNE